MMDYTAHAELARIFGDVARDSEAHAVVLIGAGRAFLEKRPPRFLGR